jgi:hypothetical protein
MGPAMTLSDVVAEIRKVAKSMKRSFTQDEANDLWNQLGLSEEKYNREEFYKGINVELEHGTKGDWNITNNDPIMTAKIALVHMDESPTYYKDLKRYVDPE